MGPPGSGRSAEDSAHQKPQHRTLEPERRLRRKRKQEETLRRLNQARVDVKLRHTQTRQHQGEPAIERAVAARVDQETQGEPESKAENYQQQRFDQLHLYPHKRWPLYAGTPGARHFRSKRTSPATCLSLPGDVGSVLDVDDTSGSGPETATIRARDFGLPLLGLRFFRRRPRRQHRARQLGGGGAILSGRRTRAVFLRCRLSLGTYGMCSIRIRRRRIWRW